MKGRRLGQVIPRCGTCKARLTYHVAAKRLLCPACGPKPKAPEPAPVPDPSDPGDNAT